MFDSILNDESEKIMVRSFNQTIQAARVRQAQEAKKETQRRAKLDAWQEQEEARKLAKLARKNAKKLQLIEAFTEWLTNNGLRYTFVTVRLSPSVSLSYEVGKDSRWKIKQRSYGYECPDNEWELYTSGGLSTLKRISAKDVAKALAETAASEGWDTMGVDFLL